MVLEPGDNSLRQQRDRYRNELAALRLEFAAVKSRMEALHCENEDLKEALSVFRQDETINTGIEAQAQPPGPLPNTLNLAELVNSDAERDPSQPEATDPPPFPQTGDGPSTAMVSGPSSIKESPSSKRQAFDTSQMNFKDESPRKSALSKFKKELKEEDRKGQLNIKIKVDEAVILSKEVASNYLSGLHPFDIVPPPPNLIFSRDFLTTTYGCISMGLLWQSKDSAQQLRFIFPTHDLNPGMPTCPGSPGYLLSCRQEMLNNTWSVFSRVQDKPARWSYFGEYYFRLGGQMSSEDFANQRKQVKSKWGQKIIKTKKWPAYRTIRERIVQLKITSSKASVTSKAELTEYDVIEAFESGAESIGIILMECMNFNHTFAKDLLLKHQTWERVGSSKGKGKRPRKAVDSDNSHDKSDSSRGGNKRSKQRQTARTHTTVDNSNSDSEED